MSALFMSRHRYSTINPEDIARVGGRRPTLNSIAFRSDDDLVEDDEELEDEEEISVTQFVFDEEEEAIGGYGNTLSPSLSRQSSKFKRQISTRRSTKSLKRQTSSASKIYRWWRRVYRKYKFNHIIPLLLLIAYSLAGALAFQAIERPNAERKRDSIDQQIYQNRNSYADKIMANLSIPNTTDHLLNLVRLLEDFENAYRPLGFAYETRINWDLWASLFYCGTIYTTVGYGNIYPETTLGWAFTIVYAFFGVPLLLAILGDIGHVLCFWMDVAWRYLKSRRAKKRKNPESTDALEDVFGESGAPKSGTPITVALLVTLVWLFMSSGLILIWESEWSYFKAFYFFFISFSTIGLGDVVPKQPMIMVLNFGFLLIGLCLVSMTIGVVQEKIQLFLFQVMVAIQKECEQLLASGQDVDKKELMKKIWKKQPWYMRAAMPAFMGGVESKRLQDFAGATMTDTAVQMGLIPPPPGYRHVNPSTLNSYPFRSDENSKFNVDAIVKPGVKVPTSMVETGTSLAKPILPKVATVLPQKRLPVEQARFLAGGRAIIRRISSADADQRKMTPPKWRTTTTQTFLDTRKMTAFVQTDLTGPDLLIRNRTLSNLSLSSWNENGADDLRIVKIPCSEFVKDFNHAITQTDITAQEIMIKLDTLSNLSLSSWCGDEDTMTGVRPMESVNDGNLLQFKNVATNSAPVFSFSALKSNHIGIQTEDPAFGPEDFLSVSSGDYVSALETRLTLVKSTQTADIERSDIETQTDMSNLRDTEVQTISIQFVDIEIQCIAMDKEDKEIQVFPPHGASQRSVGIGQSVSIDDEYSERSISEPIEIDQDQDQDQMMDVCTQYEKSISEIATQTLDKSISDLEMQTDSVQSQNAETQTRARKIGRIKQRSVDEDEIENQDKKDTESPVEHIWSYNAYFSDNTGRRRLDSVPEEDESEDEEESEEDETSDLLEEEEESELESSISENTVFLPALTVSPPSPSSTGESTSTDLEMIHQQSFGCVLAEMGVQTDPDDSAASKSTRTVACQTRKFKGDLISASIATQTEETLERRKTFPTRIRDDLHTEAVVATNRHGGSFRAKWSAWKERRQSQFSKLRHPQNRRNAGVQTEGHTGDGVRDIICQTDESWLRSANRLNALRTNRAKSLRLAVSPAVKSRLRQLNQQKKSC